MPTFLIPGKPYGKKRPRFSRATGRAYDPKENAQAEDSIGTIALPHFPAPLDVPVKVRIEATFAAPKSWSKKKQAAAQGTLHTQKPDWDNLGKTISDALNRIAWRDDGQVADVRVVKRWGRYDETLVTVEPVA